MKGYRLIPLAASPMEGWLFVQVNPVTLAFPVKPMAPVAVPWHIPGLLHCQLPVADKR